MTIGGRGKTLEEIYNILGGILMANFYDEIAMKRLFQALNILLKCIAVQQLAFEILGCISM